MSHLEQFVRELETAEPFHPDFELLARVAERTADAIDREIVETHAADCDECRAELQDLRQYAAFSDSAKGKRRLGSPHSILAAAAIIVIALFLIPRREEIAPLRVPKLATDLAANERLLRGTPRTHREIDPLSPVGRMVLDDRPSFQWAGVRNATYRVEIFDEQFHPVVASPPLSASSWTPPRPLLGGRTYVWQITTTLDGETFTVPQPPAPEARFHVIERGAARAIDALERNESRPSLDLGVAYAEAGALAEAQREFSALVAANRQAERARSYLAVVQAHTP